MCVGAEILLDKGFQNRGGEGGFGSERVGFAEEKHETAGDEVASCFEEQGLGWAGTHGDGGASEHAGEEGGDAFDGVWGPGYGDEELAGNGEGRSAKDGGGDVDSVERVQLRSSRSGG